MSDQRRELDAQVAAQVMGWTNIRKERDPAFIQERYRYRGDWPRAFQRPDIDGWQRGQDEDVFEYSTDLATAWLVVEHLRAQGYLFRIADGPFRKGPRPWHVTIESPHRHISRIPAVALPEAICRAALAAVQSEATP